MSTKRKPVAKSKAAETKEKIAQGVGGVAAIAGAAGAPWAAAVAALAAFLNNVPDDTVEVIGDLVRHKESHTALMHVTEANAERANAYGFGGQGA